MIVLLIGPSGIGKTTLGRDCALRTAAYDFIDLDDAVAERNNTATAYQSAKQFGLAKFLSDCRDVVASYELRYADSYSVLLVAVGEWALRMDEPEAWLADYPTISLMAPADEVFRRRHTFIDMTFEDYCRFNYSEERKRIFASCDIALDIGNLTQAKAVEKIIEAIETLRHRAR